ncbi:hypothetical protein [Listeria fleischmannii]|uniref:hypothetical protein n=1 Tax=Listeria fleischmannii TaxID=1069827 RepID=UPI0002EDD304|nr:hypothetical protein [Listeria fleischmannii]
MWAKSNQTGVALLSQYVQTVPGNPQFNGLTGWVTKTQSSYSDGWYYSDPMILR